MLIKNLKFLFLISVTFFIIGITMGYGQQQITAELKAIPEIFSGQCPITMKFLGKITVKNISGPPITVQYKFIRSDGASAPINTIVFEKDGTKEVNTTWKLGGSSFFIYEGWQAIKVVYPQELESNKATFKIQCKKEAKLEEPPVSAIYVDKNKSTDEDKDKDGIPDAIEEELIRKFRPYYKFSEKGEKKENYRPTDAIYQIRYSQLKKGDWPPGDEPPTVKECGDPKESFHINPPSRILQCLNRKLDILINPVKTSYYLNIMDSKRKGSDWGEAISKAPGLYGHVVKDGQLYKIEYWQFFGYSGQDVFGGDHEGDWCTVQLFYDPQKNKLVKTVHWAHGKGIAFDLEQTKDIVSLGGNFFEYRGPNYNSDPGDLRVNERYPSKFQNNVVRFYKENDGMHVVVYIERDAHEFWPTEKGSWIGANEHNGKGPSYLTAYIPGKMNLGEVKHPLSEESKIILRYNGFWGCYHHTFNNPPPGPVLHCQWTFPENERDLEDMLRNYCEH